MKPILAASIAIAATLLVSCAQHPQAAGPPAATAALPPHRIQGTVTQISGGHGNVYTDIRPDQYESLALVAGTRMHVAFAKANLTLAIGRDYADVPRGTPMAVLHREGLTFAVRDGNFSQIYGIAVGEKFTLSPAARP